MLDMPGPDGTTQRAHLDIVEQATGEPQYEEPDPPAAGSLLWQIFWELNDTRQCGLDGLAPLTHCEVAAWCNLMALPLSPWEVQALMLMDKQFIKEAARLRQRKK